MKTLAGVVFLTGVAGYVVLPYTLLTNFVALEYIFLGAGLVGVSHSLQVDDFEGQFFLLSVLAVAAAEAALGLAFLVQFYRLRGNVQTLMYPLLKAEVFLICSPEMGKFVVLVGTAVFLFRGVVQAGGFFSNDDDPGDNPDDWWKPYAKAVALAVGLVLTGYLLWRYFPTEGVRTGDSFSPPPPPELLFFSSQYREVVDQLFEKTWENPYFLNLYFEEHPDPQEILLRLKIQYYCPHWKEKVFLDCVTHFSGRGATPSGVEDHAKGYLRQLVNQDLYPPR